MTAARRLAAILPVDVFGDSRLMGEDEAGTAKAVREHRDAAHPITLNANYGFPPTATSTVMIFNDRFTSIVLKNSIFRIDHNSGDRWRPR
ncbi:MAG TPA: hypothetical protein VKG91_19855 [Roseiarcus sp.]|nr:hypothetical protein [Roseiarcus sp.]